jgi:hypothetical protein
MTMTTILRTPAAHRAHARRIAEARAELTRLDAIAAETGDDGDSCLAGDAAARLEDALHE